MASGFATLGCDISRGLLSICAEVRRYTEHSKGVTQGRLSQFDFLRITRLLFHYLTPCIQRRLEVFQADCLYVPFRDNTFDAALSIAVIHHMSTRERRIKAMMELLRIVRVGGRYCIADFAHLCRSVRVD